MHIVILPWSLKVLALQALHIWSVHSQYVLSCLEDIQSAELPAYLNSEGGNKEARSDPSTPKMIFDGQSHPERLETQR